MESVYCNTRQCTATHDIVSICSGSAFSLLRYPSSPICRCTTNSYSDRKCAFAVATLFPVSPQHDKACHGWNLSHLQHQLWVHTYPNVESSLVPVVFTVVYCLYVEFLFYFISKQEQVVLAVDGDERPSATPPYATSAQNSIMCTRGNAGNELLSMEYLQRVFLIGSSWFGSTV